MNDFHSFQVLKLPVNFIQTQRDWFYRAPFALSPAPIFFIDISPS
jgi:6-phosphogluconate dehydrogenase